VQQRQQIERTNNRIDGKYDAKNLVGMMVMSSDVAERSATEHSTQDLLSENDSLEMNETEQNEVSQNIRIDSDNSESISVGTFGGDVDVSVTTNTIADIDDNDNEPTIDDNNGESVNSNNNVDNDDDDYEEENGFLEGNWIDDYASRRNILLPSSSQSNTGRVSLSPYGDHINLYNDVLDNEVNALDMNSDMSTNLISDIEALMQEEILEFAISEDEMLEENSEIGLEERNLVNNTYHELEQDLNDISGIAMYPKYGSYGTIGQVHYNRVWLEILYTGPNGDVNTLGDTVGNDFMNCLVANVHRSHTKKCVHGCQIYIPSNQNSNFAKLSKLVARDLVNVPMWLSEYLSSNRPGSLHSEFVTGKLKMVMAEVDLLFNRWIATQRYEDNKGVRVEFTMVFNDNDFNSETAMNNRNMYFYWPVRTGTNYSYIGHNLFLVRNSSLYSAAENFYQCNCVPIVNLLRQTMETISTYEASTKTRLVWAAESIVRETMNKFYVGKIHRRLIETCHRYGKFDIHYDLRMELPPRDSRDLEISWGINPCVYPTKHSKMNLTDRALERINVLKEAVVNHRGKIDFPQVSIEAIGKMWVTIQRFGLNRTKYDDIGVFEEPNWTVIATMSNMHLGWFINTMIHILVKAYRNNCILNLNQQLRKASAPMLADYPNCHNDVTTLYEGNVFLTTGETDLPGDCTSLKPQEREPLKKTGAYLQNDLILEDEKILLIMMWHYR
jgi:hypothetical protein